MEVPVWVSVERSCSEDFDLRKRRKGKKKERRKREGEVNCELLIIGLKTHRLGLGTYLTGTTPARNSTILIA